MSALCFLADENVHRDIVAALRAAGHELHEVGALDPGITDEQVAHRARELGAILLTNDLDFGEICFRGAGRHAGELLLRLGAMSFPEQAARVARVVDLHGHLFVAAFSVLSPTKLRIR